MAGRIDKALKDELVAAGQWEAFQRLRDELKRQGYNAEDARVAALAEIEHLDDGDPAGPDPDDRRDPLPVAPPGLAGRQTVEPEVARWVARNIDNADASPEDCPDPFAWTLLRMCRANSAFSLMFVKDIWTKLLATEAKRQDRSRTDGDYDGKPTVELIDQLLKFGEEAERERLESLPRCPHCGESLRWDAESHETSYTWKPATR